MSPPALGFRPAGAETDRRALNLLARVRVAALYAMLALSLFVVRASSHNVAYDAHAAVTACSTDTQTGSLDDDCFAGCPLHGWQVPAQGGSIPVPLISPAAVVFASLETTGASRAIPPPRKPPRTSLRVADAG